MKWFFKALYGAQIEKWIRERALHTPDADVTKDAAKIGISVAQWRAVEAMLQDRAIDAWQKW